jgi:hypothetical protein
MTGLPRITISPHTGGWVAVCGTCGWRLWASRRPPRRPRSHQPPRQLPTTQEDHVTWLRRLLGLPPRHVHDWHHSPPTLSGWGLATCQTCGYKDIY